MRRLRLYTRLLLWFCAANVVTLLVSVAVTERLARLAYGSEPDWARLAQEADAAYIEGGKAALARWAALMRRREHLFATLYENGRNLLDAPPWPPLHETPSPAPDREPAPAPPDEALEHQPHELFLHRLRPRLGQLLAADNIVLRLAPEWWAAGTRVVGRDGVTRQFVALRGPQPLHARLTLLLVVQILLSLLVIGAVGWWIARGIARPLAALQNAAQRMAAGDLGARVGGGPGDDEIGTLAREFDRMAARLEALVQHERGVLQDVSHELRSPLARLQLILELARREPQAPEHLARAEREIARLDTLIDELLSLSRLEAELPGMERERVDLAQLASECVANAQLQAQAHGVTLELTGAPGLETVGTAALLARALDNLLANAIKFGAGGTVEIALARVDAHLELAVRDHGPGVPPQELPILFRPFFRGANAARAEGHGLGLAIVERIVRAHGGTVAAENAQDGGLRVRLRLPAAPAA
jgi:two-component system OmpR family sensor kinase